MGKIILPILILFATACSVTKPTQLMHPYSGNAIGCGNFIIYQLTEDNQEYVSIKVDINSIAVQSMQSYALGKAQVVSVTRKKFDGMINQALCNDVMVDKPRKLLEEEAQDGILEVFLTESEIEKASNREPFIVTVVIKKVSFETMSIDYLRIENVNVGWLPG